MRILKAAQLVEYEPFIDMAVETSHASTCLRAKCGAVIVSGDEVIGLGYNSPPGNLESQRRCLRRDEIGPGFKSDKTCCVHAEERAVIDALKTNANKLPGSTMFFARLTEHGDSESTQPYCTICSKMTLDAGITHMVLKQMEGWVVYDTTEYNDASFAYGSREGA
jgi:deoxycytidylate deaminase